ncbi:hypothetical protein QBL07_000170 (plasmid) [Gordonia rubripertincta]|uniref:Uncharacterized protein n=1 Tax=Gordonia rubripertincta TaxID=36822 RepID=A0AAW6RIB1_GORRU|nr:hypothetical protein [Gordonia rubripertincta]MCZ4537939.1 hypothetical protein [Gordonia terrae]MDG6782974.1 hypothetical protein [Gordonia rubripertincta]
MRNGNRGYRHPKCYANVRGGCSTKISGEHYISHSLIKLYSFDDPEFLFQPTANYRIPVHITPKKFVANVLCTTHNSELSSADQAALDYATFLRSIAIRYRNGAGEWGEPEEVAISGADFQRWMLKLLITHAAAGVYTKAGETIRPSIPDIAVDLLLGHIPWPAGWGMCITSNPANDELKIDPFSRSETIIYDWWGVQPLVDGRTNTLGGGVVDLAGVSFPLGLMDQRRLRGVEVRPASLTWVRDGVEKRVSFDWSDGAPHRTATFTMVR